MNNPLRRPIENPGVISIAVCLGCTGMIIAGLVLSLLGAG